ncbi:MAG: PVC-type heme-binding CxxCH protein [Pirellulales bacterium]
MFGAWMGVCLAACSLGVDGELPRVVDDRLRLDRFADAPDIVTPVGIAVDPRGRVFVVESHTHFPPPGYKGPQVDRIRLLEDRDGDGKAELASTFYEGEKATMSVAFHPDGTLLVATRSEILRLVDRDDDGKAEERRSLIKFETSGAYPHNGLSGFACDLAGNLWFGMGENLGADYVLIGADGRRLKGGGEGGNIYRCDAEGRKLERTATGFWNPFHLAFDAFGRLFTVDNDPDSRPPCRLIHVVQDGDYGYRFRNGRRGTHPFTAWNGELPGTLPMAGGTGEAPSGVAAYESTQWPADYRGDLLVTSWGDHRIDRFRLRPRGASVVADSTPVVVGDDQFRPVGIAVAPDGSVYFSDWVDKSYQLHGKGRVWKLSAKSAVAQKPKHAPDSLGGADSLDSPDRAVRERAAWAARQAGGIEFDRLLAAAAAPAIQGQPRPDSLEQPRPDSLGGRVRSTSLQALIASVDTLTDVQRRQLAEAVMREPDPGVQAMAVERLNGRGLDLAALARQPSPVVRAAVLRVLKPTSTDARTDARQSGLDARQSGEWLWAAQDEADPFLRQAALASLARNESMNLDAELTRRSTSGQRLAVALLARQRDDDASRRLISRLLRDDDPRVRFVGVQWIGELQLQSLRADLVETLRTRAATRQLFEACLAALERLDGVSRKPTDELPGEQYVVQLLLDDATPLEVRRLALRMLRPDHPALKLDLLRSFLAHDDAEIRLEAIRSLREHPSPDRIPLLIELARRSSALPRERAEAVLGLDAAGDPAGPQRATLLELAIQAAPPVALEALRGFRSVSLSDDERRSLLSAENRSPAWLDLRTKLLSAATNAPPAGPEPADAWLAKLEGPADPESGERIFFHPRATGCYRCHEFRGRGAGIGPELTEVTRTMSTRRLVESLVDPSREVAPQFTPWQIVTDKGEAFVGLLFAEEVDGTQKYVDSQGRERRLKPDQIDERQPVEKSIMPDGLPHLLTEQEFRDLTAFLKGVAP